MGYLGLPSKWESLGSYSQLMFLGRMQGLPECSSPLTPRQRAASQGHDEKEGAANLKMFMDYSLVLKGKAKEIQDRDYEVADNTNQQVA